jgi:hypothetical protein
MIASIEKLLMFGSGLLGSSRERELELIESSDIRRWIQVAFGMEDSMKSLGKEFGYPFVELFLPPHLLKKLHSAI